MSIKKTVNYELNQWELNDKPIMEEFNEDNRKIDAILAGKVNSLDYITSGDITQIINYPSGHYVVGVNVTGMPEDGYGWLVSTTMEVGSVAISAYAMVKGEPIVYTRYGNNGNWSVWAQLATTGKTSYYTPELYTTDGNQDFTYRVQHGRYKLIDDMCILDYMVTTSDKTFTASTGLLKMTLPVPNVGAAAVAGCSFAGVVGTGVQSYTGMALVSDGMFQMEFADGGLQNLNVDYIRATQPSGLHVRGQISYYWK